MRRPLCRGGLRWVNGSVNGRSDWAGFRFGGSAREVTQGLTRNTRTRMLQRVQEPVRAGFSVPESFMCPCESPRCDDPTVVGECLQSLRKESPFESAQGLRRLPPFFLPSVPHDAGVEGKSDT